MNTLKVMSLFLILSTLFVSGCLDTETKEAIEEIAEQHIANDISKPYGEVRASVTGEWQADAVNGSVEIFKPDAPIFQPSLVIDVNNGYGTSQLQPNKLLLYSRTPYAIGFDGNTEHYDQWYTGNRESFLPEYATVTSTIPFTTLVFNDVARVGTINNWNFTNKSEGEVQNIDLYKDTSFIFEVFAGGNYGRIKNPVLSFVNDWSEPFEHGEFGSVKLELVSGLDMNTPYDITEIVKSDMCGDVPLWQEIDGNGDRWINAGSYAQYRLTFHDIDYTQLTKEDVMKVYLDDLDGYRKGDIFKSTKADAVQVATIYSSVDFMKECNVITATDETIILVKDDKVVILDNRA